MDTMEQGGDRKLPEIELAGIRFFVDVARMALSEVGNPLNVLSTKLMENRADGHSFLFDRKHRSIEPVAQRKSFDTDRYEVIHLPRLESLDPMGMEILVRQGMASMPETHFQVVDIMGKDYFFTARSNFQEVDNPWNVIPADRFEKFRGKLGFWYNQERQRIAIRGEFPARAGDDPSGKVKFVPILGLLDQLRYPAQWEKNVTRPDLSGKRRERNRKRPK